MVGRGTMVPAAGIGLKAPVAGSSLSKVRTLASTKVEIPAASSAGGTPHFSAMAAGVTALGLSGSAGFWGLK